jgi:hypothetical protein
MIILGVGDTPSGRRATRHTPIGDGAIHPRHCSNVADLDHRKCAASGCVMRTVSPSAG